MSKKNDMKRHGRKPGNRQGRKPGAWSTIGSSPHLVDAAWRNSIPINDTSSTVGYRRHSPKPPKIGMILPK